MSEEQMRRLLSVLGPPLAISGEDRRRGIIARFRVGPSLALGRFVRALRCDLGAWKGGRPR
jgi:hypothetical protein